MQSVVTTLPNVFQTLRKWQLLSSFPGIAAYHVRYESCMLSVIELGHVTVIGNKQVTSHIHTNKRVTGNYNINIEWIN